jgi:hypothetical protein
MVKSAKFFHYCPENVSEGIVSKDCFVSFCQRLDRDFTLSKAYAISTDLQELLSLTNNDQPTRVALRSSEWN